MFDSETQCRSAHDKSQGKKLKGKSLVVVFAKKRSEPKQTKHAKNEETKAATGIVVVVAFYHCHRWL